MSFNIGILIIIILLVSFILIKKNREGFTTTTPLDGSGKISNDNKCILNAIRVLDLRSSAELNELLQKITESCNYTMTNIPKITSIKWNNNIKTIGYHAFDGLQFENTTLDLSTDLPNLTTIGEGAFSNTNLTKIILPKSIKTLEEYSLAVNMEYNKKSKWIKTTNKPPIESVCVKGLLGASDCPTAKGNTGYDIYQQIKTAIGDPTEQINTDCSTSCRILTDVEKKFVKKWFVRSKLGQIILQQEVIEFNYDKTGTTTDYNLKKDKFNWNVKDNNLNIIGKDWWHSLTIEENDDSNFILKPDSRGTENEELYDHVKQFGSVKEPENWEKGNTGLEWAYEPLTNIEKQFLKEWKVTFQIQDNIEFWRFFNDRKLKVYWNKDMINDAPAAALWTIQNKVLLLMRLDAKAVELGFNIKNITDSKITLSRIGTDVSGTTITLTEVKTDDPEVPMNLLDETDTSTNPGYVDSLGEGEGGEGTF